MVCLNSLKAGEKNKPQNYDVKQAAIALGEMSNPPPPSKKKKKKEQRRSPTFASYLNHKLEGNIPVPNKTDRFGS